MISKRGVQHGGLPLHIPITIVSLAGIPTRRAGRSHDIGTRGICFHCEGELRPGFSLEFVLEMSRRLPEARVSAYVVADK